MLVSNYNFKKRDWFLQSWGNENFDIDDDGKRIFLERYRTFQEAVVYLAKEYNRTSLEYDYYVW